MLLTETAFIRLVGLVRIPLLFFVGPQILRLDEEGCAVKIPLGYRTRNHVGSMYVGTLAAGADLASALNALKVIRAGHKEVVPLFKDLHCDFLKRADGDVVFRCDQGREVAQAVARAGETESVTLPVQVVATVPDKYGDEPVARFTAGLSLRRKSR